MIFFMCRGVVEILCHLLQSFLFMRIILQCRLREKRKYFGIILALIIIILMIGMQTENRILYLTLLLTINFLIVAFCFQGNNLKNGMIYLSSEFAWFLVDLFFSALLIFLEKTKVNLDWEWSLGSICTEALKVFFILFIGYHLKISKKEKVWPRFVKKLPIYYYFIFVSFLFFTYVAVLTVKISYGLKDNPTLSQLLLVSVGVLCLLFVINGGAMLMLNSSSNFFQAQNQLKDEYIYAQNQFYSEIYKGDLEIQKFRHDTYNQINSMKVLLRDKKYNELEEYMLSFYNRVQKAMKQKIESNNEMVDAILNHLILEGKEEGVPIYLLGSFPEEISVNSYDLCAILSNAVSNAIKLCKEIPESNKRHIEISVKNFRNTLSISVANTVGKIIDSAFFENKVWKEDISNFGIGIRTIIEAVERNGGEIEFKSHENRIAIEILFYDVIME
ncbi:sensor histidine kinase [Anaerosacchariphilus polymeriproducens]|uniref:GHKL domain-containing protein n=1 Tax=Anaerosacchariphilus polymeriproducens TaxID=1812858 RepID=A0A371ASC8_9FIRM|nr:GHKL domain-containing protein [Anaerosacchariphilus polymeriproducens]RDU22469.1 GHKL domain-containing protein [Anaerosacchariphilus polymeriproducens]